MKKEISVFKVALLVLIMSGCVTNRSKIVLNVPELPVSQPNGKQVYIRSVTDSREFQERPASPDIPSLMNGVAGVSKEIKERAVGRKRGAFGKALGDFILKEDDSVSRLVYESVRNVLVSQGYEVTNQQKEAEPAAMVMDITVNEFWSWYAPGAWASHVRARIAAGLTVEVSDRKEALAVTGSGEIPFRGYLESQWTPAIQAALSEFMDSAQRELKKIDEIH